MEYNLQVCGSNVKVKAVDNHIAQVTVDNIPRGKIAYLGDVFILRDLDKIILHHRIMHMKYSESEGEEFEGFIIRSQVNN